MGVVYDRAIESVGLELCNEATSNFIIDNSFKSSILKINSAAKLAHFILPCKS